MRGRVVLALFARRVLGKAHPGTKEKFPNALKPRYISCVEKSTTERSVSMSCVFLIGTRVFEKTLFENSSIVSARVETVCLLSGNLIMSPGAVGITKFQYFKLSLELRRSLLRLYLYCIPL